MFLCETNSLTVGLRCQDHADSWLAYVCRNKDANVSARIVEIDDDGWCVDCAGDVSGDLQIIDVDHAMDVFAELNWERYDYDVTAMDAWRNNDLFRQEFTAWLTDPVTLATYTFEFDPYTVSGRLPVVELTADEAVLVRDALFGFRLAMIANGVSFEYSDEVWNSLINKLGGGQ